MSRKTRGQQVGVALFPFLAVLICTMGALIVLLVLLMQQARLDATVIAGAKEGAASGAAARQLRERIEDAQWRREMLEKSRSEKTTELANSRSRLAHLEEHIQRLQAQAQELIDRARSIDEGKQLRDEDLEAARAEAARLKAEIDKKKKELDEAKQKKGDGQEWYALIPYDGRNGTRRRPIYIECTEFGVVIQPEGLILRAEDFNGPLGPGNPLDMALRAVREHIERTAGAKAAQPYPLLVVRPSGVVAFGAAKAAIKAWDDEWGYELISDEKSIDFGPADPALNDTLTRTVNVARQRQAAVIAMTPRQFANEEPLRSFAPEPSPVATQRTPGGGAGIGSGSGVGAGGGSGNGMAGGAGGTGGGLGRGGASGSYGGAGGGGTGTGSGGNAWSSGAPASGGQSSGLPSVMGGGGGTAGGMGSGGSAGSGAAGESGGTGGGSGAAGFAGSPLGGNGSALGSGSGFGGGQQGTASGATGSTGGYGSNGTSASGGGQAAGGAGGAAGGNGSSSGGGAAAGGNSGGYAGGGGSAGGAGGSASGGSASGGGGSAMSGAQTGMGMPAPNLNLNFGQKSGGSGGPSGQAGGQGGQAGNGSPQSTARRGKNWALPQAKTHQIGVTRPIRVSLQPDRIVMLPEWGDSRAPQTVPVAPELGPDDVNRVVTAVQGEIKGWGLAVAEGYWKPVLQAEVAPGAERHFMNLEMALKGSGIEIIKR